MDVRMMKDTMTKGGNHGERRFMMYVKSVAFYLYAEMITLTAILTTDLNQNQHKITKGPSQMFMFSQKFT